MSGFNANCPFHDIFHALVKQTKDFGRTACSARFIDGLFFVGCGTGSDVGYMTDGVDRGTFAFEQMKGEALLVCEPRYPHLFFPDSALCFTESEFLSMSLRHKKMSGGWVWIIQNISPIMGDKMSAASLLGCLERYFNQPGGCLVYEIVMSTSDLDPDAKFLVACGCLPTFERVSTDAKQIDPLDDLARALFGSRPPRLFNEKERIFLLSKSPILVSFTRRGLEGRVKEVAELLEINSKDLLLICDTECTVGRKIGGMRGGRCFPHVRPSEYIIVEGYDQDRNYLLPCLLQYFDPLHVSLIDLGDFQFPYQPSPSVAIKTETPPPAQAEGLSVMLGELAAVISTDESTIGAEIPEKEDELSDVMLALGGELVGDQNVNQG